MERPAARRSCDNCRATIKYPQNFRCKVSKNPRWITYCDNCICHCDEGILTRLSPCVTHNGLRPDRVKE